MNLDEGNAGEAHERFLRHYLAHDGNGSVFNSLFNEQVAVEVFAFNGDKYVVRPGLPAVIRRSPDIRCYMWALPLYQQI